VNIQTTTFEWDTDTGTTRLASRRETDREIVTENRRGTRTRWVAHSWSTGMRVWKAVGEERYVAQVEAIDKLAAESYLFYNLSQYRDALHGDF
jgi:hypothetical protein